MTATDIHPAPAEFSDEQLMEDPILRFFHFTHLPPSLRDMSQHFCYLARNVVTSAPRSAERTMALRKLLEAKDCAVRALLG